IRRNFLHRNREYDILINQLCHIEHIIVCRNYNNFFIAVIIFLTEFYQNIHFGCNCCIERFSTDVTNQLYSTARINPKLQKSRMLFHQNLGLYPRIGKFLLCFKKLKERIIYLKSELMFSVFQTRKSYIIISKLVHKMSVQKYAFFLN